MRQPLDRPVACLDPEILLMDEPLGALDAITRDKLQDDILRIWETTQKTILLVTHSVEEAAYLADCVVVMTPRPGRIRAALAVPFRGCGMPQHGRCRRSASSAASCERSWMTEPAVELQGPGASTFVSGRGRVGPGSGSPRGGWPPRRSIWRWS